MRPWLALACLALILAGCVGGYEVSSTPRLGTLVGRLQDGRSDGPERVACLWIETDAGTRVDVVLPDRWQVTERPVTVLDEGGHLVAEVGDRLLLSGPVPDGGASMCAPGKPFITDTVTVLAPSRGPSRGPSPRPSAS